jgi:hypothetical protein
MRLIRDCLVPHTKLHSYIIEHIHKAPAKDGQRAARNPNDAGLCSRSIGLAFWYALRSFVCVYEVFLGLKRWR